MENVGIFYGQCVNFPAIWYILRSLTTFYDHLVYFSLFRYVVPLKIWQPWLCQQKMSEKQEGTNLTHFRLLGEMLSLSIF
jgi:hypothetical protein